MELARLSHGIRPVAMPRGHVATRSIAARPGRALPSFAPMNRRTSGRGAVKVMASYTKGVPEKPRETALTHETEVVIIGSGVGGLCAGALLARYGINVTVCEAHEHPGGCAHAFQTKGYTFESGPTLYQGLAWQNHPTSNPLGQVLQALDEPIDVMEYKHWMCHFPETGSIHTQIGNDQFLDVLQKHYGEVAVKEWIRLKAIMKPLASLSTKIPAAAVRPDAGGSATVARFLPKLGGLLEKGSRGDALSSRAMLRPFQEVIGKEITHPFVRNWLDTLCLLLTGRTSEDALAAEIGYLFKDWYSPDQHLEYPVGGSGAVVGALTNALDKYHGRLELNTRVDSVIVEGKRAVGVRLASGDEIRATRAVISNASIWDTLPLLPPGAVSEQFRRDEAARPMCDSFMHLHLGVDARGLKDLELHHLYVEDWDLGVSAPQNLVVVSIPSVVDPSLAPPGKHVVHAYTPGTEPYSVWEGLDRKSKEYEQLKRQRSEVLWRAVEKAIPNARKRAEVQMVGTPLTHERYLNRKRGTYGGWGWVGEGKDLVPDPKSPLPGLLCIGDSHFPGPGLPGVAAGGVIAANSLVPVYKHWELLDRMGVD